MQDQLEIVSSSTSNIPIRHNYNLRTIHGRIRRRQNITFLRRLYINSQRHRVQSNRQLLSDFIQRILTNPHISNNTIQLRHISLAIRALDNYTHRQSFLTHILPRNTFLRLQFNHSINQAIQTRILPRTIHTLTTPPVLSSPTFSIHLNPSPSILPSTIAIPPLPPFLADIPYPILPISSSPSTNTSNTSPTSSPMSMGTPIITCSSPIATDIPVIHSIIPSITEEAIRNPTPTIPSPRFTLQQVQILHDIHQQTINKQQIEFEKAFREQEIAYNNHLIQFKRRISDQRRQSTIHITKQQQLEDQLNNSNQRIINLTTQLTNAQQHSTSISEQLESAKLHNHQLVTTNKTLTHENKQQTHLAQRRLAQQSTIHQQTLQTLHIDHTTELDRLNTQITSLTEQTTYLIATTQKHQEEVQLKHNSRRDKYTQTTPTTVENNNPIPLYTNPIPQYNNPIPQYNNPIPPGLHSYTFKPQLQSTNTTSQIHNILLHTTIPQPTTPPITHASFETPEQTPTDIPMAPPNTQSHQTPYTPGIPSSIRSQEPNIPLHPRQSFQTQEQTNVTFSSSDLTRILDDRLATFTSQIRQETCHQINTNLDPLFQVIANLQLRMENQNQTQQSEPFTQTPTPLSPNTIPANRRTPKPRINILQLDQPANRPFTQEEIDAFLHIPQHRITEVETRNFVSRIESHLTHDPNDLDANKEATALRQIIPHLRWQRLAEWAQVYTSTLTSAYHIHAHYTGGNVRMKWPSDAIPHLSPQILIHLSI